MKLTLLASVLALILAACGESGEPDTAGSEEPSDVTTTSTSTEGTTVGGVVAEAELGPVDGFSVYGTVTFKEVDDLGVQVELNTAGWSKPGTHYYAQIHEGDCTSVADQGGTVGPDDHVHEPNGAGASSDHDHEGGAEDHHRDDAPAADELAGDIDQPIEAVSSDDGTSSVTSLLEGVTSEQILSSGEPKYLDLHVTNPEVGATVACANLSNPS